MKTSFSKKLLACVLSLCMILTVCAGALSVSAETFGTAKIEDVEVASDVTEVAVPVTLTSKVETIGGAHLFVAVPDGLTISKVELETPGYTLSYDAGEVDVVISSAQPQVAPVDVTDGVAQFVLLFESEDTVVNTVDIKLTFAGLAAGETYEIAFTEDTLIGAYIETAVPANLDPGTIKVAAAHVCTPAAPVEENKVDADCENAGSYDEVVYCSECNKEISRTSKTIDALGHDYGTPVDNGDGTHTATCANDAAHTVTEDHIYIDGKCVCGAEEKVACDHANATVTYELVETKCVTTKVCECGYEKVTTLDNLTFTPALNLSAGLAVNFRLNKKDINSENVYAIINHDVYSDDNTISGTSADIKVIPTTTGAASNPRHQFTYTALAAREMLSEIHVKVFAIDEEGDAIFVATTNFVLASYLKAQYIDKASTYKTLAADILRYGAESQKAFAYRTGVLPTAGVDESVFSTLPTTFTNTDIVYGENDVVPLEPATVLGNTVALRFRAKVISGISASDLTYTIEYINAAGEPASASGEVGYNANNSKYQFEFANLPVAIINDYYTITLWNGDEQIATMQYSFQSDASSKYASNHSYKVLAQAICAYSSSAAAVFKS